jgi:hypothetical protein
MGSVRTARVYFCFALGFGPSLTIPKPSIDGTWGQILILLQIELLVSYYANSYLNQEITDGQIGDLGQKISSLTC